MKGAVAAPFFIGNNLIYLLWYSKTIDRNRGENMKRTLIASLLVVGMALQVCACQSTDVSQETETSSASSETTEDITVTTESETEPGPSFTEVVEDYNCVVVYYFENGKDEAVLREQYYDSNHNEIKTVKNDTKGRTYLIIENEYDDRGNVTKNAETHITADDRYSSVEENEYDKDNRLIKTNVTFSGISGKATPVHTKYYSYDSKGNLTSITTKAPDGKISGLELYEYDDAGNKTKYTEYHGEDELVNLYEYEYDQTGNMIKKSKFRPDGSLMHWYTYEYDSKGNMTVQSTYTHYANGTDEQIECLIYEYDSNNNCIKLSRRIPDTDKTYPVFTYIYDDANNLLRTNYFDDDKGIFAWEDYCYEKK